MDYCSKTMPSICVRDARCPASYFKTAPYQVDNFGNVNPGVCQLCPGGQYRPVTSDESLCLDCDAGYYGNTSSSSRSSSTCDGTCPQGSYCTLGSPAPILCSVGTYGLPLNASALNGSGWTSFDSSCMSCPPGSYCDVPGNTNPNLHACSPGRCGYIGQSSSTCSAPCPGGYYCPSTQGSACPDAPYVPNITYARACGDGFLGASFPSGSAAYCPSGSFNPSLVNPGYYGAGGINQTYNVYQLPCPIGTFCVNGTQTPCPAGTYTNQVTSTNCTTCSAGYYCPPGSTSATQQLCAPSNATNPALYYCPAGTATPLVAASEGFQTLPDTSQTLYTRQSIQPCPLNKVCVNGLALDRIVWGGSCTNGAGLANIPEMYPQLQSGVFASSALQAPLNSSDFIVTYNLASQAFYNPNLTSCVSTTNDGIFGLDNQTGQVLLLRHSPDPYNHSSSLDYEVCPPNTVIQYNLTIVATATPIANSSQPSTSTCVLTITVLDQNDQPIFPESPSNPNGTQNRVILDGSPDNTPAVRCTVASFGQAGCPVDTATAPDVSATDEDEFGNGNLYYSFVGNLTGEAAKLKISSCTGLISSNGNNPISFYNLPPYDEAGIFRRIPLTVMAIDDGNYGKFPPRNETVAVYVYVQNVNHAPVFHATTFYIQELLSAGTVLTPPFPNWTDVDFGQTHTLSIVQNDGDAFQVVNNTLVTTLLGSQEISYQTSKKQYSITLMVQDDGSPPLSSEMTFAINVLNNNQPPVIDRSDLTFFITEYANVGDSVCRVQSGECVSGDPANAITSTDANVVIDGITTDETTYLLLNDAHGRFTIDPNSGMISVARNGPAISFLNSSYNLPSGGTGRGFTLVAQATSNGVGTCPNPLPASDMVTVYVYIVHQNHAPYLNAPNLTTLVETAPIGSTVAQLNAADPDNSIGLVFGVPYTLQTLTYALVPSGLFNDGSSVFGIASANGVSNVILTSALNYYSAPDCGNGVRCFELVVSVSDNGNPPLSANATIILPLLHVNRAPLFPQMALSVNLSENTWYGEVYDIYDQTLSATDPDPADNAILAYQITGGSGTNLFTVTQLGPGLGFTVTKLNGALLNFEVNPVYTLVVQASDYGPSHSIGAECALVTASSDCGAGALCDPTVLRCFEKCQDSLSLRVDTFFCVHPAVYNETVSGTVTINVLDDNDNPYVLTKNYPVPNIINNQNCSLSGAVVFALVAGPDAQDQYAISGLTVWDDDVHYLHAVPHPEWGTPFGIFTLDGDIWDIGFNLNSTSGALDLPANTPGIFVGQVWNGTVVIVDNGGAQSTCFVSVTVVESNVVPDLGPNRYAPISIAEHSAPGPVVLSFYPLYKVDTNVLNDPPEVLTFFMSPSPYFSLDSASGNITLSGDINYEDLLSTGFTLSVLVLVEDSHGNSAGTTITFNITEVPEPPYWVNTPVTLYVNELVPNGTVIASLLDYAHATDVYASGANAFWKNLNFSITSWLGAVGPIASSGTNLVSTGNLVFPNSWTATVNAVMGTGLSTSTDITITLLEVEQPPYFTTTDLSINVTEGSSGTALYNLSRIVADPNTWDNPVATKLTITIVDGDTGGVFLIQNGVLIVSPLAVLDYEDIYFYNLTISVTDTRGESVSGYLVVNVMNVNDVSISAINVVGVSQAACTGQTQVSIVGTNLGMVSEIPKATFALSYQRSYTPNLSIPFNAAPPIFSTTNCTATSTNVRLVCWIAGAVGTNLLFTLSVVVPGTQIQGDQATYQSSISFVGPTLTALTISGSTTMATSGGDNLAFDGTCLGSPLDQLLFGGSSTDSYMQVLTLGQTWRALPPLACNPVLSTLTRLVCSQASLVGLGPVVQWRVTIAQSTSAIFTSRGYTPPSITEIWNTMNQSYGVLSTSGSLPLGPIDLVGSNFGALGQTPDVAYLEYFPSGIASSYEFSLLNCVVISSFTRVRCSGMSPGAGQNLNVTLSFGGQLAPIVSGGPTLTFAQPILQSIGGDGAVAGLTIGGQLAYITGSNFGPACGSPGVDSAHGALNCDFLSVSYSRGSLDVNNQVIVYRPSLCAVLSQTLLSCATVPGTGDGHVWTVNIGSQVSTSASGMQTTSYASPVIGTYVNGLHQPLQPFNTVGDEQVIIQGSYYGPVGGAPVFASYGPPTDFTRFAAINCSVTLADTEATCTTAPGAGVGLSWSLLIDGQASRAELTDYAVPSILNITLLDGSPATALFDEGGQALVVNGNNFGPPLSSSNGTLFLDSITYGPLSYVSGIVATSSCSVTSHFRIDCVSLPGVGANHDWQVRVRGQSSDVSGSSPQTSYNVTQAFMMTANFSLVASCDDSTTGGGLCFIRAQSVGFCAGAGISINFGSKVLSISGVYNNDVQMVQSQCPYPQLSPIRDVEFTVPQFDALSGVPPYQVSLQVSSPLVASGTYVASNTFYFNYAPPEISEVYAEPGKDGSITVTFAGTNFCASEVCCSTMYVDNSTSGDTIIQPATVLSHTHTQVVFSAPAIGYGFINCTGTGQTFWKSFAQHNPFVFGATLASGTFDRLDAVQFDTSGGTLIYVYGAFFGSSPLVTIGGLTVPVLVFVQHPCGDTSFFPDTISTLATQPPNSDCYQLTVAVPPGQGVGLPIVVAAGDLQSLADDARFDFVNYGPPQITSISQTFNQDNPTSGSNSVLLEVFGKDFGLSGKVVFGPVGGLYEISCAPQGSNPTGVEWSHTRVACYLPPGEGYNLPVSVISANRQSSPFGVLRYAPPIPSSYSIINSANSLLGDTRGGQTLVLVGVNFGRALQPNGPTVMIANFQCLFISMDISNPQNNQIFCETPVGEGSDLLIMVTVGGASSVLSSQPFGYSPPIVLSITPSSARTSALDSNNNSVILHISGINFGYNILLVELITPQGAQVLGKRNLLLGVDDFLLANSSANHTDIFVPLIRYVGANLTVRVTVAGQSNDNSTLFSYLPPVIGSLNGLPVVSLASSTSRRLNEASLTGQSWSTQVTPCRYLLNNGTVQLSFTEQVNITVEGNVTKELNFYSLAPTLNESCSAGLFLGTTSVRSNWVDLGEHSTYPCTRLYVETSAVVTGYPLPSTYRVNGYGAYFIAEETMAYFSRPAFDYLADLNSPSTLNVNIYDDYPTVVMDNPSLGNLTTIPTSGCLYWEALTDYQARVQISGSGSELPRLCQSPVLIPIIGDNFGDGSVPGSLRVWLKDAENNILYEASTTGSGGNHNSLCTSTMGCVHTDTKIVFMTPFGAGRGLHIVVQVGNLVFESGQAINYDGPLPTSLDPGSIIAGNQFLSSVGGEAVRVLGSGMGYTTSLLSVYLNAKPCTPVAWNDGTTAVDGEPSLACNSAPDVAGIRSVFVCVGGQGKMTSARQVSDLDGIQAGQGRGAWSLATAPLSSDRQILQALATARCPSNTYGGLNELCVACPTGANCSAGFGIPVAQANFALFALDRTSELALGGYCPPERTDPAYQANYSSLVLHDVCYGVAICVPPTSCLGENQCEQGYEYELLNCLQQRGDANQTCRVVQDPFTGVVSGADQDCRSEVLAIGQVCSTANPMDCSSCHVHYNGTVPYGICECDPPPRCSLCTVFEYYRLNNQCVPCPSDPGLIVALFVMAAVGLIALGYWLQKKNVNLGFLSVGVDYFQVLGVLATTNVPWPPVILAVFQVFEVFLASIDIAAPECLISNLEFPAKFYFTESMPFMALGILMVVHIIYTIQKVYKNGRRVKWLSHVGRLVGIYILIIYVLYLSLTKYALDVFDCNPLSPDDGYSYTTFSSLSCDGGGLCRCNQPGGLQQSLVPSAIGFLMLYSGGFPLVVATILYTNRREIEEDQYLRAYGLGTRRETNQRAWATRKKYKLIYMYYKPEYHFWMLAVLARKFGIAFAALMFRGNPSFQLATILIVLFVCFTVQVKNRPYMSTGEYPAVVFDLNQKSKLALEDSSYLHYRDLVRKVAESQQATSRISRSEKAVRTKAGGEDFWTTATHERLQNEIQSRTQKYFFDLNAVEAILLASITVISLSGIMFESGQFTTRPDLAWTGQMTTILVLVLLFGTLIYYLMVCACILLE